jgi:hypothetical protein
MPARGFVKKIFEISQLDPKSSHKAAAMAFPTSCVLAEPPMSAVRGAPLWGANTFSMAANTASWAGLQPKNSNIMAPHQI